MVDHLSLFINRRLPLAQILSQPIVALLGVLSTKKNVLLPASPSLPSLHLDSSGSMSILYIISLRSFSVLKYVLALLQVRGQGRVRAGYGYNS